MENGSKMRHLMWILTWIAVGIGGALGAASVIMLSASRTPTTQSPEAGIGKSSEREPVLVTKPRNGGQGRSLIATHPRHSRSAGHADLMD
jgi:hypothetical protein